jgi:hypothetical protein
MKTRIAKHYGLVKYILAPEHHYKIDNIAQAFAGCLRRGGRRGGGLVVAIRHEKSVVRGPLFQ